MKKKPYELDMFMICEKVNKKAFKDLPKGFKFVKCNENSLDDWKRLSAGKPEHIDYVSDYFNKVYANRKDEFFERCILVEDEKTKKVGTCFIWDAYKKASTLHWFAVSSEYEGLGIGRAILTKILSELNEKQFPIYLHTHPHLYRAIGLYADFGFKLINTKKVGRRNNDYSEGIKYIHEGMAKRQLRKIESINTISKSFEQIILKSDIDEF